MSKRFIVENKNIQINNDNIKVFGEDIHHINALRYRVKDEVYINEYLVKITNISKNVLEGRMIGKLEKRGEAGVNITLIQSYLKSDKMDYVVQKAVELGVKNIIPIISINTVVRLDAKDKVKKQERLLKIAKEATQQCGRTDNVNIEEIVDLNKVDFNKYTNVIICHEKSVNSLEKILQEIKKEKNNKVDFSVAIIIGPEGGFEDNEVKNIIKNNNVYDINLGERILRAETSSIYVLSIISYVLNN